MSPVGRQRCARRVGAALLCLLLLPAAAQRGAALLNSERIEARFGSFGIDVLQSDDGIRISDLYSTDPDSGERTTRTLALVEYPAAVPPDIAAAHARILAGGSIGATLQADGWKVLKSHRYFGTRPPTPALRSRMRLLDDEDLAVHVYALDVAREDRRLPYVRILEIHHPAYLDLDALRGIYAPAWQRRDNADIGAMLDALAVGGF